MFLCFFFPTLATHHYTTFNRSHMALSWRNYHRLAFVFGKTYRVWLQLCGRGRAQAAAANHVPGAGRGAAGPGRLRRVQPARASPVPLHKCGRVRRTAGWLTACSCAVEARSAGTYLRLCPHAVVLHQEAAGGALRDAVPIPLWLWDIGVMCMTVGCAPARLQTVLGTPPMLCCGSVRLALCTHAAAAA